MKFTFLNAAIVSLVISYTSLANAGLITNGGFETGNLSGWVDHNGGGAGCRSDWYVATADRECQYTNTNLGRAGEGNFSAWNAFDGAGNSVYEISQSLNLGEFDSATLSFDYTVGWDFRLGGVASLDRVFSIYFRDQNNNIIGDAFSLSIGLSDGVTGLIGWSSNTVDVTSMLYNYSNQEVRLFARTFIPQNSTGPASFGLDSVDVTTSIDVPEPSRFAMFAVAIVALVSRRLKKQS